MPSERAKKFDILDGPIVGMRGLAVGGLGGERQIARLDTIFALGHYTVEKPLVSFDSQDGGPRLGTGMVLGTLLLEHFVVTFDARKNRVRLARESKAPITPPNVRTVGLGLKRKGKSMEVCAVHPHTHASSLGIIEGSLVYEINGQPAVDLYGTKEWDELIRSADTVRLRYSRGGSGLAKEVEVRVMDWLASGDRRSRRSHSSDDRRA